MQTNGEKTRKILMVIMFNLFLILKIKTPLRNRIFYDDYGNFPSEHYSV